MTQKTGISDDLIQLSLVPTLNITSEEEEQLLASQSLTMRRKTTALLDLVKGMFEDLPAEKKAQWTEKKEAVIKKLEEQSDDDEEGVDEEEKQRIKEEKKKKRLSDLKTQLKEKVIRGPFGVSTGFSNFPYDRKAPLENARSQLKDISLRMKHNERNNVYVAAAAGEILKTVQKKLKNKKKGFANFLDEKKIGIIKSAAYFYMKLATIAEIFPTIQQLSIPLRELQAILPYLKEVCSQDEGFWKNLQ